MDDEPVYAVWESGTIESFSDPEEADLELKMSRERGLYGVLINDVTDAIIHLGRRHGIDLCYMSDGPVYKPAGESPYKWKTSDSKDWIYKQADKDIFFVVTTYPVKAIMVSLDGLPQAMYENLSWRGKLEYKISQMRAQLKELESQLSQPNCPITTNKNYDENHTNGIS